MYFSLVVWKHLQKEDVYGKNKTWQGVPLYEKKNPSKDDAIYPNMEPNCYFENDYFPITAHPECVSPLP